MVLSYRDDVTVQQYLIKQDQQPTYSRVHKASVNEKMFSSEIMPTFRFVKFSNFLSRLGLMFLIFFYAITIKYL